MKKIIIISTFSLTTLLALVVAFTFGVPHKRTVAANTSAAYASIIDETLNSSSEIVIQSCEMAASKIKEALLTELQAEPKRSSNDKFFFEYHPSSPKLLACLLMATKEHAAARKLLEGNGRLDLDQLQALREHKATCDIMRELEVLEGQRMSNVVQKLVEIVKGLDVQPTEADIDERIREIALTLKHVAIIADGNRRWAKRAGLHPFEGHKKGFIDVSPKLFQESWRLAIHTFTLWCLSTNNIVKRSSAELENLFFCFNTMINETMPLAKQYNVRIVHLGRKDRLPEYLLKTIQKAEQETLNHKKHVLNIAIDYSGRDEIIRACTKMAQAKFLDSSVFKEKDLEAFLDTHDQPFPNPDLMIRTSGEMRSSGFMAWQGIYAEFYYPKIYYPEMSPLELKKSIIDFSNRKRTFSE